MKLQTPLMRQWKSMEKEVKARSTPMNIPLETIVSRLSNQFDYDTFILLTDYLTQLLTRENNLLQKIKIQEIEELQHDKSVACKAYANSIRMLRENTELIDMLTQEQKQMLKEMTENLSYLLDRNERTIDSFNNANRQVMEIIMDVVNKKTSKGYTAKGTRNPPPSGYTNFNHRS